MKFLPPFGASRQFIPFTKQQLLGIHALIDAKQIPIDKSPDFFEQVCDIESTLPDQAYTQALRRYRSLTKAPALVGTVSAIALIAFVLTLLLPESNVLSEANASLAAVNAPSLSIITGAVTCLLLAAYAATWMYVRSLSARLAGKRLSKWWGNVLRRWAPELATQHDTSTLSPENIAHLVAVQTKIQDVNLELGPTPRHKKPKQKHKNRKTV